MVMHSTPGQPCYCPLKQFPAPPGTCYAPGTGRAGTGASMRLLVQGPDSAQACFGLLPGLSPVGSSGPGSAGMRRLVQAREAALTFRVPPGCSRGLLPPPAGKLSACEESGLPYCCVWPCMCCQPPASQVSRQACDTSERVQGKGADLCLSRKAWFHSTPRRTQTACTLHHLAVNKKKIFQVMTQLAAQSVSPCGFSMPSTKEG